MLGTISRLKFLIVLAVAFAIGSPAYASTITIDGPWYQFSFTEAGALARGCFPEDLAGLVCDPNPAGNSVHAGAPAWTFTAPAAGAELTVTDAFEAGDFFRIFDFGAPIGATSVVPVDPTHNCGADPVPCLADPLMSHGFFLLGAGAHSITIRPGVSPYGSGAAYFRVDSVPEPASLLLIGSGLIGLAMRLKRKA